ncbi:hypothetical protein F4777DRAFT_414185 [Nemania sp. FL0916]|nr:hypothetical protein F4777DRAFT_414185 [Nemania sp. FL0916]
MAEPTNTPMPTAPPTPRSGSPVPPLPALGSVSVSVPQSLASSPTTARRPQWPHPHSRGASLTVPVPVTTTISGPPTSSGTTTTHTSTTKPVVLHIGDPVQYNPETYVEFAEQFDVVRPSAAERTRPEFIDALRERRWGDFAAIFRPFWGSGGEMGAWDAELIDLLPESVCVFASAGAGFDWADVKLLGEKGILYCNSGLAAGEAVADFAVALIVGTFRALPYCLSSARTPTKFQAAHEQATALAHNLRGRVLGLVGFGTIGQGIAQRCAAGFGMAIAYYDVERKPNEIETTLHAQFYPSLEALIRAADCVVLCAPSGAGRIINSASLRWFKPGGRLVNVARGALVDEDALADALEQDRLCGAALDVHFDEPNVSERLLQLADSKVLLTCHNAGGTVETHVGFEELCMRNIMAVLSGGDAITPVNLEWLGDAKTP